MKRNNIERCRNLRKKQTDAEKKLWAMLRNRQLSSVKFRRQVSVGRYIVDFYCPEFKIGIEADGGQHYEIKVSQQDDIRTKELNKLGVNIIRFSDKEILTNIDGVCGIILKTVEKRR
jgi:very-short-patch-repair endonuclease